VVFRGGAGEVPPSRGLDAIADVDRRLRGRRGSGMTASGPGVLETGGEVGVSGLGVWVREEDGFEEGGFDVDGED